MTRKTTTFFVISVCVENSFLGRNDGCILSISFGGRKGTYSVYVNTKIDQIDLLFQLNRSIFLGWTNIH